MDKNKLTDIIVSNILNKGVSVLRPTLNTSIHTIKQYFIQNNIDISIIDKQAFKAAIFIRPVINKIISGELAPANIVFIAKRVNQLVLQLETQLNLRLEDMICRLFVLTYFMYMMFIISCKIATKKPVGLNIPTVAVFMAPLLDELGLFIFAVKKERVLPIKGYFRSSKFTRLFFDSLFAGGFNRPFSIESLAVSIMYDSYLKLFENKRIKRILKTDVDNDINNLCLIFFILLISIYSLNITPYLNRSSRYLVTKYEENK
jgi:hypothetical protein